MSDNKRGFSMQSIGKYLPVFVILLAISIMVGSTFAYFTDKTEEESTLTFSKVELSGETTTGINGKLRDVIPGTPLVDGALKFSKSIDSEAIYVRAKISFSLPIEYVNDNDMKEMVDLLRSATDFNIVSEAQNGAVWSVKDGNYFYLVNSADTTKLMRVDTIDTYTLSNEIVVPRDLKNLPDNAQYMKSVNFHVAFEAIQADNVSDVLSETKETFNVLFPTTEAERYVKNEIVVNIYSPELSDIDVTITLTEEGKIEIPNINMPVDEEGTSTQAIVGWYTDSAFQSAFDFSSVVNEDISLYPLVLEVSQGLAFEELYEDGELVGYSVAVGECTDTEIVVPSAYMGKPVTQVAASAFAHMFAIERVYLPETITRIGDNAFDECFSLVSILLPNGITSIGEYAFSSCKLLSLISLPDKLTSIGLYTFNNCESLTSIALPVGLTSIPMGAFGGCTSLERIALPNNLITVGECAFLDCTSLISITLPDSVTNIDYYAFSRCTSLVSVSLSSSLISISDSAFDGCTNLTFLSFSGSLTSIGFHVFENCNNLKYVLCETQAVVNLVQSAEVSQSSIYVKDVDGYSGFPETEIVINDSLTIYQVELGGYMWIRNGNDYYKCIFMHDDSFGGPDDSYDDPFKDDWL